MERIREALASATSPPLLQNPPQDDPLRFTITVQEGLPLGSFFKPEDFTAGPPVPGGVYAFEQQRLLNNSVTHPLTQPYAAFSGRELIVIAIENLIGNYVGRRLVAHLTDAQRAAAEAEARATVQREVAQYCASLMRAGQRPEFCDVGIR